MKMGTIYITPGKEAIWEESLKRARMLNKSRSEYLLELIEKDLKEKKDDKSR